MVPFTQMGKSQLYNKALVCLSLWGFALITFVACLSTGKAEPEMQIDSISLTHGLNNGHTRLNNGTGGKHWLVFAQNLPTGQGQLT